MFKYLTVEHRDSVSEQYEPRELCDLSYTIRAWDYSNFYNLLILLLLTGDPFGVAKGNSILASLLVSKT